MITTYGNDVCEVERVAEGFLTVLDGVELLGCAAYTALDSAVDIGDSMRQGIEEAVLNGDPRLTGLDGAMEYYASVATIVALSVFGTPPTTILATLVKPGFERAQESRRSTTASWTPQLDGRKHIQRGSPDSFTRQRSQYPPDHRRYPRLRPAHRLEGSRRNNPLRSLHDHRTKGNQGGRGLLRP